VYGEFEIMLVLQPPNEPSTIKQAVQRNHDDMNVSVPWLKMEF